MRDEGLKEIPGTPVPVPVSPTVCGEPATLSETVIVPVRVPTAVGVNVTEIEHDPPIPIGEDVVQF